jgi:AP-2 complex subunit alpha
LLRLFRRYPDLIPPETGAEKLVSLLDEHDFGILTSAMGLLLGLVAFNPKGYEVAIPKVINLLIKVIFSPQKFLTPLPILYHIHIYYSNPIVGL